MNDDIDTAPLPLPTELAVLPEAGTLGPVWDELAARAAHYATRARGDGTRRTYRSAWTHFCQWCASLARDPLSGDPELVAMYVVRRADDGLAVSSIRVAVAAIRTAYQLAGVGLDLSQPRFRMTLESVVRSRGVRPTRQAAPAVPDVLAKMLAALPSPDSPLGIRNRAMLLLGFGAALRCSELVGLCISDVARVSGRGLIVLVRRSKTDQHGRGQQVAIWANPAEPLTCPLAALERWLAVREAAEDVNSCFSAEARDARPLFCGMSKSGRLSGVDLSDKAVARLVKTVAEAAGLDPRSIPATLYAETQVFFASRLEDLPKHIPQARGGFKLVIIDTPPQATDLIRAVVQLADLVLIPTRPSPDDLDAVGRTIDIVEDARTPMIFVVNGATRNARITGQAAIALSQSGTVASTTLHHSVAFLPQGLTAEPSASSTAVVIRPRRLRNYGATYLSAYVSPHGLPHEQGARSQRIPDPAERRRQTPWPWTSRNPPQNPQ